MKTVKVQPLTKDAFAPFGEFYSMEVPDGKALTGELHAFYPDRIIAPVNHTLGFSPISVKKPERYIVTQQEYHTYSWEMILPLDDDMILHVAEKSAGVIDNSTVKAFLVPKGTLIKIEAGVWHLCPLPASREEIHCMIVLPECTYINDCICLDTPEDQQFEIIM